MTRNNSAAITHISSMGVEAPRRGFPRTFDMWVMLHEILTFTVSTNAERANHQGWKG